MIVKKLVKHGNSWALVIDRPILELLSIDPEDYVQIVTDGSTLIVSPAESSERTAKIASARTKINAKHKAAFKKLAE